MTFKMNSVFSRRFVSYIARSVRKDAIHFEGHGRYMGSANWRTLKRSTQMFPPWYCLNIYSWVAHENTHSTYLRFRMICSDTMWSPRRSQNMSIFSRTHSSVPSEPTSLWPTKRFCSLQAPWCSKPSGSCNVTRSGRILTRQVKLRPRGKLCIRRPTRRLA